MKKKFILAFMFSFLCVYSAKAQDYFSGLISNLNKSHSAEAIVSLGAYKSSLLGCFTTHDGKESQCVSSVNFNPTVNFTYDFLQTPKDGSQAWSMKASGKGNYAPDDAVMLISDENGSVICKAIGKMAGAC